MQPATSSGVPGWPSAFSREPTSRTASGSDAVIGVYSADHNQTNTNFLITTQGGGVMGGLRGSKRALSNEVWP